MKYEMSLRAFIIGKNSN